MFLDISWIKEKLPNAPEHIKKKLPSMYHQFMQLANLDITKEPMEVGPTTHYAMGGVRVNGETQMSSVPGLFAAGECAAGLHGSNRLGGNSLSDLLVFGKRAGEFAAKFAKEHPNAELDEAQVEASAREALEPFEHGASTGGSAEGPYQIQHELQNMMQDLVGIVRNEGEMKQALANLGTLRDRAGKCAVYGHREYNPGWHTALDFKTSSHRLGGHCEISTGSSGKPRWPFPGGFSREECRGRQGEFGGLESGRRLDATASRADSRHA